MKTSRGMILLLDAAPGSAADLREILSEHYGKAGYRVVASRSADEVLHYVKDPGDRVVAIVADRNPDDLLEIGSSESRAHANGRLSALQFMRYAKSIRPDIETILCLKGEESKCISARSRSAADIFLVPKGSQYTTLLSLLNERLEYYDRLVCGQTGAGRGKHVFFTGASGFLGGEILRQYLATRPDCHFWVLSRKKGRLAGEERILSRIPPQHKDRVTVLEGELGATWRTAQDTAPKINKTAPFDANSCLGLDNEKDKANFRKFNDLLEVCDEVLHCASYLSFSQLPAERMKLLDINLMGTQRVLNLVERFKKPIQAFNYIGTAFIHGIQSSPDVFYEDSIETQRIPTRHLNPYEMSKAKATTLIAKSGLPYRVFNPPIIGGDLAGFGPVSEAGQNEISTDSMFGVFDALHMGSLLFRRKQPDKKFHIRIPANPEGCLSIIPRNKLVEMIVRITQAEHSLNHVYNTVHPVATPIRDAFNAARTVLDFDYEFVNHIPTEQVNAGEALFYRLVMPLYGGYLHKPPAKQDMENVRRILGAGYVESIPALDENTVSDMFKDHFRNSNKNKPSRT